MQLRVPHLTREPHGNKNGFFVFEVRDQFSDGNPPGK